MSSFQQGLYQYNYLPFGTSCSPAIFQKFLTEVLSEINSIVIYQDDILCYSENLENHEKLLDKVLSTLMEAGIKINHEKCQFLQIL